MRASSVDLDVLVGQYLVDISAELAPQTVATYQGHVLKNVAPQRVQGTNGHAGVPEMVL